MARRQRNLQLTDRELLQPTYQNRLRVIGYHLDVEHYRDAAIFEIEGGFIARATPRHAKRAQALEFPDSQFEELMHAAINHRGRRPKYESHSPVLPTGYQDFLRSLGFLLDNQGTIGITICELESYVLISGLEPSNSVGGHNRFRPFERYLTYDDIQQVLDDAFQRRTNGPKRGGFLGLF